MKTLPSIPLKLSDSGNDVEKLQRVLIVLGFKITANEKSTKYFGDSTEKAVRDFQNFHGLKATGQVDDETYKYLFQVASGVQRKPEGTTPRAVKRAVRTKVGKGNGEALSDVDGEMRKLLLVTLKDQIREYTREGLMKDITAEIDKVISELPPELADMPEGSVADVMKRHVLPAIAKDKKLAAEYNRLEEKVNVEPGGDLKGLLHMDKPIKENPLLQDELEHQKVERYGKRIGLSTEKLRALSAETVRWQELSEGELDMLVSKKILTEKQKEPLRRTIELAKLTGDNDTMAEAIEAAAGSDLRDLVKLGRNELLKTIQDKNVPLPDGDDAESYADSILFNIESTYSTPYVFNRLAGQKMPDRILDFKWLDNVPNEAWTPAGGVDPALDVTLLVDADNTEVFGEAIEFINTYQHLGVGQVLRDKHLSATDKKNILGKKAALVSKFYQNNPDIDLRTLNMMDDASIDWKGIPDGERRGVRNHLMATQRVAHFGTRPQTGVTLMKKGFDSAIRITDLEEEEFIMVSGLDKEEGRVAYRKAQDDASAVVHTFEAMRDLIKGNFKDLAVSNTSPALPNDLKQIDGFSELFGNQDFCDCEHCKSIFSPAAYFTDLMYFVQTHVSKKLFIPNNLDHPLYLKNRRGDLWNLQLTCENTNTQIPYLQIVNEVLEAYLKDQLGANDVYRTLSNSQISCHLPFNLPLAETRTYLSHFDLTLYDVYKSLRGTKENVWREKINLSAEELAIILTDGQTSVANRFGNLPLADLAVEDFLNFSGLTRAELDELLAVKFIDQITNVSVQKKAVNNDIQQFKEVIKGLNAQRLDLMHRLIRLWQTTGWKIKELDLVLMSLRSSGKLSQLGERDAADNNFPKILHVAMLHFLQNQLSVTVEELAALAGNLPGTSLSDAMLSFRERIFDMTSLFGVTATLPDGKKTYGNQFIIPANKANDNKSALVLAGLGISEQDLAALLERFGEDLSVDITVDPQMLSKLYAHARFASALKLSVAELLAVMDLFIAGGPIAKTDEYVTLAETVEWIRTTPFSVSELAFIVKGEENETIQFNYTREDAVRFVKDMQKQKPYNPAQALQLLVKREFNVADDQLAALQAMVATDFNSAPVIAGMNAAFNNAGEPVNQADFDALLKLMEEAERSMLLVNKLTLSAEAHKFLATHAQVFGIADLTALTANNIRQVYFYSKLIAIDPDSSAAVNAALEDYTQNSGFTQGGLGTLASLWKQPEELVTSVMNNIPKEINAVSAARALEQVLRLCTTLRISGETFTKLGSGSYDGLRAARDIALGSFGAQYVDEKVRQEKLEPYHDRINTMKRDALCHFILARKEKFKFRTRNELYAFFLLDVEMSGCFRTSRVVQATGSVQLYVHRCLLNLEQSDTYLNPLIKNVAVRPTWLPLDEWEWRKNYRVWEANRKVFAFPESYIDPAYRLNKTHICKEFEEELLQEKITAASAETAYKKYIAGFMELANLQYAGSYLHKAPVSEDWYDLVDTDADKKSRKEVTFKQQADDKQFEDIYYFFARTNTSPYQYYYRTLNVDKKMWGNWEKIELGIEAKEVSAIIFSGRLYLFWTEVQDKEISSVKGGNSESGGHVFKVFTKFSYLNENNKWSPAQRLYVGHTFTAEDHLFGRVWGNQVITPAEREKKKEYTLEQYQEKVFRKPYVVRNNDLYSPLTLNYIWTKDKGIVTVNYAANPMTKIFYLMSNLHFDFYIPGATFQVINGNFANEKKSIKVNAYAVLNNKTVDQQLVDAEINLSSPSDCVVSFSYLEIAWAYCMSMTVQTVPQNIKGGKNVLSLAKNTISDATLTPLESHFSNITSSPFSFLQAEYDKAYVENGDYVHYVETGDKAFTDKLRIVTQFRTGDAHLQIGNGQQTDYIKLSTVLTDELAATLFAEGMEEFLSLKTQQTVDSNGNLLDFRGAYGEYYWEMYFHMPYLIGNHLNANNKFKEAKWWYERIFNPTAEETPADIKPYDHNWRFREFRNLDIPKLKEILTEKAAIEMYHRDPFNPHAIARLRVSAYQKAVVMKYIDNLLDWGDYLFTQDTRESINEAMQLYVLASDILGKRPARAGKCSEPKAQDLTYEKIGPKITADSEFLIMLESWNLVNKTEKDTDLAVVKDMKSILSEIVKLSKAPKIKVDLQEVAEAAHFTSIREKLEGKVAQMKNTAFAAGAKNYEKKGVQMMAYKDASAAKNRYRTRKVKEGLVEVANGKKQITEKKKPTRRKPHKSVVRQSILAFCVPNNAELLKYWDRVEDRQYKIRHCMNISGVRRSLALFQPPIDPMLLVRARAAGLTLDDILGQLANPSLPPYRFNYLIEKAKQMAQMVQGFGAALLSALEKKDTEELTLLRSVHERNILKLTKDVKKKELQEAQHQYKVMTEGKVAVQQRIDYYSGLIDGGLLGWEVTQQASTHLASGFESAAALQKLLGGILYLIPQLGSPFAMKYGGSELGNSAQAFGEMTRSLASIAHAVATSAGLEATFQRREQEWKNQLQVAGQEMKQSVLQELAAEVRQAIAEKQLSIHEATMEQAEEVEDFYKNKFSSLGLYQFLTSRLNRVYREAYNLAYDLARMTERAFQYERNSTASYIAADNWQFDRAGLMAGEALSLQLQRMEQDFMSGNVRVPEITQSFSLALLQPQKLLELQQSGSCTFKIPEVAFESFYPGQFNRVVRGVRLTMPCMTGPFTNVSAKLTLLKGEVEKTDKAVLTEELQGKNTSVTMSSANGDAGMFEFNLRDERYLPFEGAGAISEWRLELPSVYRSFDYRTISDVILQLSYTASDGNRTDAEAAMSAGILAFATTTGLFRIVSLKHEFGDAFHKLLNPAAGQPHKTDFRTLAQHFPFAVQGRSLVITQVKVYLSPKKDKTVNTMNLAVNTVNVNWLAGEDIAYTGALNNQNKIRGGTVAGIAGSPIDKNWVVETTGGAALDSATLEDVMILVKYRIA